MKLHRARGVSPGRLWHYTVGEAFEEIMQAQQIALTEPKHCRPGERPAVWFSAEPRWEPTVMKVPDGWARLQGQDLLDVHARHYGGAVRIGVSADTAPYGWKAWQRMSHAPSREVRVKEALAKLVGGNPHLWYVSFDPVPASAFQVVEQWREGAWVACARVTDAHPAPPAKKPRPDRFGWEDGDLTLHEAGPQRCKRCHAVIAWPDWRDHLCAHDPATVAWDDATVAMAFEAVPEEHRSRDRRS